MGHIWDIAYGYANKDMVDGIWHMGTLQKLKFNFELNLEGGRGVSGVEKLNF